MALSSSSFLKSKTPPPKIEVTTLTYEERAALTDNVLGKRIFNLMAEKKTNLCLSADVKTAEELLVLVENVGSEICILKTHCDISKGFDEDTVAKLVALSIKHNFIIFEDAKFSDIGETVESKYTGGNFEISKWATLINAHLFPGEDVVKSLKKVAPEGSGLLLIGQMSSKGNFFSPEYTASVARIAELYASYVVGFICQETLSNNPGLINFTPGVQIDEITNQAQQGDGKGQNYNTPEHVIQKGTDVIIVGRGIFAKKTADGSYVNKTAEEALASAQRYRREGWEGYELRSNLNNRLKPSQS